MKIETKAVLKSKDGFIREEIVNEYRDHIRLAVIPPIKAYKTMEEVDADIKNIFYKDYFLVKKQIVLFYEEK